MFRSRKLLDLAHGQECTIRIPGVCTNDPQTVVAAHSNWYEHGKGGAMKAHDCFTAWACAACHREIDQGKDLSYEEKKSYWQRGFEQTLLALFERGLVRVK